MTIDREDEERNAYIEGVLKRIEYHQKRTHDNGEKPEATMVLSFAHGGINYPSELLGSYSFRFYDSLPKPLPEDLPTSETKNIAKVARGFLWPRLGLLDTGEYLYTSREGSRIENHLVARTRFPLVHIHQFAFSSALFPGGTTHLLTVNMHEDRIRELSTQAQQVPTLRQ